MKIPPQITAGDSASWLDDQTTDNLGNAIDSTWTLKYVFQQANADNITVTSVTDGSGWKTSLTKAQTVLWVPNIAVYFQAYAEKSTDRISIGSGSVKILPNISGGDTDDLRSQAQQDLDAIQAAMRAMISGGAVAEYTIGNRSLRKLPMSELLVMESRLKAEVAREKQAENIKNGLGNNRNVFVRFGK